MQDNKVPLMESIHMLQDAFLFRWQMETLQLAHWVNG